MQRRDRDSAAHNRRNQRRDGHSAACLVHKGKLLQQAEKRPQRLLCVITGRLFGDGRQRGRLQQEQLRHLVISGLRKDRAIGPQGRCRDDARKTAELPFAIAGQDHLRDVARRVRGRPFLFADVVTHPACGAGQVIDKAIGLDLAQPGDLGALAMRGGYFINHGLDQPAPHIERAVCFKQGVFAFGGDQVQRVRANLDRAPCPASHLVELVLNGADIVAHFGPHFTTPKRQSFQSLKGSSGNISCTARPRAA